jgi:Ca2+-binding RTX toxin-like protein
VAIDGHWLWLIFVNSSAFNNPNSQGDRLATFDFRRLSSGVDSDAIIQQVLSYGPLKSLKVLNPTATQFELDPAGPAKVRYKGEDFKYTAKDDPKSGFINSVEVIAPQPQITFKITGLEIDISKMKAAFASATPVDDIAFVASIFDQNDTFEGSRKADKLYGFKGKDTMNGSDGQDSLDGGAGNDVLSGGKHADQLTGGGGKDSFVFSTAIKAGDNVDVITDFNATDDTIKLDDATIYKGLGTGTLDASLFHVGDVADFKDGGIIYDANGDLWYDVADRQAYKFAHLDGTPTLTNADFVIV